MNVLPVRGLGRTAVIINHPIVGAADSEKSEDFHCTVLGFERETMGGGICLSGHYQSRTAPSNSPFRVRRFVIASIYAALSG
jgi:hypothetical protein